MTLGGNLRADEDVEATALDAPDQIGHGMRSGKGIGCHHLPAGPGKPARHLLVEAFDARSARHEAVGLLADRTCLRPGIQRPQ